VGRQAQQHLAFAHVGSYQREVEHLEVAQAAVDQTRRTRRGARGQVILFHKRHPQAA
jgi:hypothetical protein